VGGQLGTWDVALSDCQTGELSGFYGADFFVAGTTNIRLRYVHDEATGEILKIFYPDKEGHGRGVRSHGQVRGARGLGHQTSGAARQPMSGSSVIWKR
jgi:hypothetical protein